MYRGFSEPSGTSTSQSGAIESKHINNILIAQVGISAATMSYMLFLFAQVCLDINEGCCYLSNDRFLLLLFPHTFCSIMLSHVFFLVDPCFLVFDTESNLGPVNAEKLAQFKQMLQLLQDFNSIS